MTEGSLAYSAASLSAGGQDEQPWLVNSSITARGSAPAAVFAVIDPLAPNWQVREEKQADGTWRISMRMKRFTTGGDGEAIRLFHRSAERIVRENKHAGYRVLQYSEGIESSVPLAQRYSEGTIRVIAAAP